MKIVEIQIEKFLLIRRIFEGEILKEFVRQVHDSIHSDVLELKEKRFDRIFLREKEKFSLKLCQKEFSEDRERQRERPYF